MDEMFAIKCQNCGGPMYSHQAKRSLECAYCGTVVPWQADAGGAQERSGHSPYAADGGGWTAQAHACVVTRAPGGPGLVFLQFALAQSVGPGTSAVG